MVCTCGNPVAMVWHEREGSLTGDRDPRGADAVAPVSSFAALSARDRAASLTDPGTLSALTGDASRTVWAARGRIADRPILIALTDGHQRGGTVGVEEAGILTRLSAAARRRPLPLVICWDTGGVRVQEGPPALAAASAAGVALTRLALLGVPVVSVISGPRGCFGAPSVIAATADLTIMTADSHWGLTGPMLLHSASGGVAEDVGRRATSAELRLEVGHANVVVPDSAAAIRAEIERFVAHRTRPISLPRRVAEAEKRTADLVARFHSPSRPAASETPTGSARRRRRLLQHSFRGYWRSTGVEIRSGQVQAAWGDFNGRPVMGILVGAERSTAGLGVEGAHAIVRMVRSAIERPGRERAPIVTFVFCRGHADDLAQEEVGLSGALAECLKSLTAARLLGHPLVCVLGGGAYGAAYLTLAAPSHRVLAIRGTTVAPMSPRVLAAFERLRGTRNAPDTPQDLATLMPAVRIVESVVRLPRALDDELKSARRAASREASRLRRKVGGDRSFRQPRPVPR